VRKERSKISFIGVEKEFLIGNENNVLGILMNRDVYERFFLSGREMDLLQKSTKDFNELVDFYETAIIYI
jgi:hypothetical protein